MGGRVRSNAKIAPGLRGHVSKAGASFSGARKGPFTPAWLHRQPALAVSSDVAAAGAAEGPIPPIPPVADGETPAPIDLPALLLGLLFLAVLVGVSTIRV